MEHDNENTDVYTDLLPYAVVTAEDGTETVITLSEVLIPIAATTLVQRKTLIRDFTDYFDEDNPPTEDGLRAYANNYLKNNPLGTAVPTLTVAFEPLWKLPEYAAVLERVSLCDTVTMSTYLEMNRAEWERMMQEDSTVARIAAGMLSAAAIEFSDVEKEGDRRVVHYSIDAAMGMKKNKTATVKKEEGVWKVERIADVH